MTSKKGTQRKLLFSLLLDNFLVFISNNDELLNSDDKLLNAFRLYLIHKTAPVIHLNPVEFSYHRKMCIAVLDQLFKDKLIDSHAELGYFLTVKGHLFLEATPFYYRNRPYAYQSLNEKLKVFWNVVKIIAAILNALAIIYLTYLEVIKK